MMLNGLITPVGEERADFSAIDYIGSLCSKEIPLSLSVALIVPSL